MLSKVTIGKRVRMFLADNTPVIEGRVEGIERAADDSINGILLRSPSVQATECLELDEEDLNRPDFRIEVLEERLLN